MLLKIKGLCALVIVAVSGSSEAFPQSGTYLDSQGKMYSVLSQASRTLTITGDGEFCLRLEKGDIADTNQELEMLKGRHCSDDIAEPSNWSAVFSHSKAGYLIIYPPKIFSDRNVKPIELRSADGAQTN